MADSAEMSTSNQYVKYHISVYQNSQNVSNNTSYVTVDVFFYRNNSGYQTYGTGNVYCRINGTQYSSSVSSSQKITNSGILLFQWQGNISHNSDGTKTLTTSAWINIDTPLTSSEQSFSYTLSTIPRAATFSDATNFNDTDNPKIYFRNPGGFKLCLKMEAGGNDHLIVRDNIYPSSPYTFSLTTAERNSLLQLAPNSNTLSVRFTVGTYLSSGAGDWSYGDRTMTIVSANPSFSSSQLSYYDNNSTVTNITQNNQLIVQNQSTLYVNFSSATAQKYASISSYQLTFNGSTYSYSSSGTKSLGTINSSSNLTLSVKAIDSRGNSTTISKTVTCIAWQPPQATYQIARVNNFESTTNILVSTTISSVNSKNSLQLLQYRTKPSTSSMWSDWIDWIDIQNNIKTQADFDNTKAFNFQIQVQDKFSTSTYSFNLNAGQPIIFFDTNKISVGVNTFPSNSNSFETTSLYVNGKSILDLTYPVGSIYLSVSSTSPATLFGGTWTQLYNRFLIGAGSSYSVNSTGGSTSASLSTSNMPSHSHSFNATSSSTGSHTHGLARAPSGSGYKESYGYTTTATREQTTYSDSSGSHSHSVSGTTGSSGSGSSFSVIPSYLAVYMWKRTA
ncbi:MAG: DUF859 family phage minor structural protein [Oscillospiraceae bacterium]|jgi:microcystin-dependent protein|nr:DUF859 family phage minor structural protein [Oscillospiraceae bacterium]